jgi:hypothetical protein
MFRWKKRGERVKKEREGRGRDKKLQRLEGCERCRRGKREEAGNTVLKQARGRSFQ